MPIAFVQGERMAVRVELRGKQCRFVVEGEMTASGLEVLKGVLLEPFAENHDIEVDLSGVSKIDVSGLQLLVMLKLEAYVRNKRLSLISRSTAVSEIINLCELETFFEGRPESAEKA